MARIVAVPLWFFARVILGLTIGALIGLAISDYLIRNDPRVPGVMVEQATR